MEKVTAESVKPYTFSEKTVKNHVSNILQKMSVNDRTQAVVEAIKKGWVEVGLNVPYEGTFFSLPLIGARVHWRCVALELLSKAVFVKFIVKIQKPILT